MILDHISPQRGEFLTNANACTLAERALAFESALRGLHEGGGLPPHMRSGLRNHLERIAAGIAATLARPDMAVVVALAAPAHTRNANTRRPE